MTTPTPTTPTERAHSPARGVVGFYIDADGYLDVTSDWEPDVPTGYGPTTGGSNDGTQDHHRC